MLLRVYFESGEFGASLIECWSVCRRGGDGDGDDDDDQCFLSFFNQNADVGSPSCVARLVLNTDGGMRLRKRWNRVDNSLEAEEE